MHPSPPNSVHGVHAPLLGSRPSEELFVFKYVGVFVRAARSQNTLLKAVDEGKFVAWYIGAVAVEGGLILITVADTLKVKSADFLNLNLILFCLNVISFLASVM